MTLCITDNNYCLYNYIFFPFVLTIIYLLNLSQGVCEFLKTVVSKLQEDCSIALNVIIEILMIGFRKSPQPAGMLLFKEVNNN